MKKPVLFIHGAGQGAHEADQRLAAHLQSALGEAYDVRCPQMPNEDRPEYEAWKNQIANELAKLSGDVTLVGHSAGDSVLLKYLAEEQVDKAIAGVFLVAAPYLGAEGWQAREYELSADVASKLAQEVPLFFYHSRDDDIVPFAHLQLYARKLPQATFHEVDGRGHQFNDDLFEVARDIKGLQRRPS